jgi:hypothetical protein
MVRRAVCALTGRGDRRCDRAAHDRDGVSAGRGKTVWQNCRGGAGAVSHTSGAALPAVQPAGIGEGSGLFELFSLRLVEVRVRRQESMFFFEKKNQKTFAIWHTWPTSAYAASAKGQKFFASFFQKIRPFSFSWQLHGM